MDEDVFTRPGHLIQRSARMMSRWGEARFKPLGLALAQVPVLYALKDGATLSQKELAELVRVEQPTMAQLLARMERDGLVRRTPDESDGRSSLVSLTAKALRRLPQARAILSEGNAEALRGFSEWEVATLSRLLQKVVRNLDDLPPA